MGIDVYVPCPISTWLRIGLIRPSLPMRTNAFRATRAGAALEVEPGLLHLLAARRRADGLDGGDPVPDRGAHRRHARSPRDTVQMHRAGPAERDAAAELRPVHAEQVAQDPQKRHVRRRVDLV